MSGSLRHCLGIELWFQTGIEVLKNWLGVTDQRVGDDSVLNSAVGRLLGQAEPRYVRARDEPHTQLCAVFLISVIDCKALAQFGCRGANNVIEIGIVRRFSAEDFDPN